MLRPLLAVLFAAASALGQPTSSQEQQRALEEHQQRVAAQAEFGRLSGFSSPPPCSDCGYVGRLSPWTKPSFVSATTLAAPKPARKELERAIKALRSEPQEVWKAATALNKAVELHPDFAVAWGLLGKIQLAQGFRDEAQASFERAVQADSAYLEPHAELARLCLGEGDWAGLEKEARRMIRVNPYFTLGHLYLGVARFNQGEAAEAEKHALDAMATADIALFPETHHLLGQIYEKQGERELAIIHFRQFVQASPPEPWRTNASNHLRELEAKTK